MESVDEYMDKVLHYLKEVDEKQTVLVTEGLEKLEVCEHHIVKMLAKSKEKQRELDEKLDFKMNIAKKKEFHVECREERVRQLKEIKSQNEVELRSLSNEMNKKMLIAKYNFHEDEKQLKAQRRALDDAIEEKQSALSNQQD